MSERPGMWLPGTSRGPEFLDYQAAHLSPAEMEALRYWLTHEDEALYAIDAIQDARAVGDAQ